MENDDESISLMRYHVEVHSHYLEVGPNILDH